MEINTQWRHYKGCDYTVIAIAKHSETLEDMAVYVSLDKCTKHVWVRPLSMWFDEIGTINGPVQRFTQY